MAATIPVKVISGSNPFWSDDAEATQAWLRFYQENGVDSIDAAQNYGPVEQNMGKANAAARITIDTKVSTALGGPPTTKEVVLKAGRDSLEKLRTEQVDVYYLHGPDRRVPIEDTLEGVNQLYTEGTFKRFGLSNFSAREVEDVMRVAKERNFVRPSVYQGNYSAVARRLEAELFPVLRKHGIAFYAYSPVAGGFFAKTRETLTSTSRWTPGTPLGDLYLRIYNKPSYLEALDRWEQIAQEQSVPRTELAYRWIFHHSILKGDLGDGVIVGARTIEQFSETINGVKKGPLSSAAVEKIDQIWEIVKEDAPFSNLDELFAQMAGK